MREKEYKNTSSLQRYEDAGEGRRGTSSLQRDEDAGEGRRDTSSLQRDENPLFFLKESIPILRLKERKGSSLKGYEDPLLEGFKKKNPYSFCCNLHYPFPLEQWVMVPDTTPDPKKKK